MYATALNYVSIPAVDVDDSLEFYRDVLDIEEIPVPASYSGHRSGGYASTIFSSTSSRLPISRLVRVNI